MDEWKQAAENLLSVLSSDFHVELGYGLTSLQTWPISARAGLNIC